MVLIYVSIFSEVLFLKILILQAGGNIHFQPTNTYLNTLSEFYSVFSFKYSSILDDYIVLSISSKSFYMPKCTGG